MSTGALNEKYVIQMVACCCTSHGVIIALATCILHRTFNLNNVLHYVYVAHLLQKKKYFFFKYPSCWCSTVWIKSIQARSTCIHSH